MTEPSPQNSSKRRRPASPISFIPFDDYPRLLPNLRLEADFVEREEVSSSAKRRRIAQPAAATTALAVAPSTSSQQTPKRKSEVAVAPQLRPTLSPDPLSDYEEGDAIDVIDEADDVSIKSSSSTRQATLDVSRVQPQEELALPELSARLSDTMAFITRVEPVLELAHQQLVAVRELTEWCNAEGRNLRLDIRQETNHAWETFRRGQAEVQEALEKAKGEAKTLMDTISKRL